VAPSKIKTEDNLKDSAKKLPELAAPESADKNSEVVLNLRKTLESLLSKHTFVAGASTRKSRIKEGVQIS